MSDETLDDLDKLLNRWADQQEPTAGQLDELANSVENAIKEQPIVPARDAVASFPVHRGWLSIAAVVLLAASVGAWFTWRKGIDDPVHRVADAAPISIMTDQERKQKQSLLAELDRMFEGKRVWFAETEADVVVGSDDQLADHRGDSQRAFAMRLV